MPSRLREQAPILEPIIVEQKTFHRLSSSSLSPPPAKKTKMSLSQTYYIASSARSKLGKEAVKPDHNLRRLVGHANLLDALMGELRDVERQQEAWFNRSVQKARKVEDDSESSKSNHIRWADRIVEEETVDEEAILEDEESDDECGEEDFEIAVPLRRIRSPPVTFSSSQTSLEEDDEEEDDDIYEDVDISAPELALTRTHSHPPELVHDSDSDSDESPPASPPQPTLPFDEAALTAGSAKGKATDFIQEGFLIQAQSQQMIEAC